MLLNLETFIVHEAINMGYQEKNKVVMTLVQKSLPATACYEVNIPFPLALSRPLFPS